ncbi:hypothetical protein [Sandarakinorhabdus sp. DWP1-3-1]|uniref:hypothetical protein n=1 Tax=Sandarakinorhabdus sp. DWP1-3-1 TaxID=2804627 RepID=UPI003CEBAF89
MSQAVDIAETVCNPLWFADRYDPGQDAVHFRWLPRDVHRTATFLTDDYLPAGQAPRVIRRGDALAVGAPAAPLHFIFHSAFCCSTLLARAFDAPGAAMGLKEPVILNDLVGWQHRGGTARAIAPVLDAAMALLARPFAPGEAVVVKPSNVTNGLAPGMLTMRPAARALLLHAPLPVYLGSIAKKGMDGRLWARDLLVKQLREGLHPFGYKVDDYLGQTDLQVAALGWLAQHALFAGLAGQFPERVRTLDSEVLMAQPAAKLAALAAFYGIAIDVPAAVAGPAFTTHSKSGAGFDGAARAAEIDAAAGVHADEIAKVTFWAGKVAEAAGVPMVLPLGL